MNNSLENSTFCFNNSLRLRSRESYMIFLVAVIINFILGLPTNAYVLWMIVKGGRESVTSDYFALNLSVTETLFCLFSIIANTDLNNQYLYYVNMSVATSCINVGRPLFQSLMCVERYVAVIHPVVYLRYKRLDNKVACSALAWLTVFVSSLTCIFARPSRRDLYYSLFSVIVVCFCVNSFCCQALLRTLKRQGPGEGNGERKGTNSMKMRAFRMLLVFLVSMIINYTPALIIMLVKRRLNEWNFELAVSISFSFAILYGFIQPLLHFYRIGKLPCKV